MKRRAAKAAHRGRLLGRAPAEGLGRDRAGTQGLGPSQDVTVRVE